MRIIYEYDDVKVIKIDQIKDDRGWFCETFKASEFYRLGLPTAFPQTNHSQSKAGVIRGLHFQPGMGKLMRVTRGSAIMVAFNLNTGRLETPYYSTAGDGVLIWAPGHYARGFQALSPITEVQYMCTEEYDKTTEGAINYNSVGAPWINNLFPFLIQVSEKDRLAPTYKEWKAKQ